MAVPSTIVTSAVTPTSATSAAYGSIRICLTLNGEVTKVSTRLRQCFVLTCLLTWADVNPQTFADGIRRRVDRTARRDVRTGCPAGLRPRNPPSAPSARPGVGTRRRKGLRPGRLE